MTRKQTLTALLASIAAIGGTAAIAQSPAGGRAMHGGAMMMADANKDGTITRAEMTAAVDARFAKEDTNRDGTITPEERQASHQARRTQGAQQRFAQLDTDHNGQLSLAEFSARHDGMGKMGGHGMRGKRGGDRQAMNQPVTKADAQQRALAMFDRLDANKDGKVTQAEREAMRGQWRQQRAQQAPQG